jgi:hypothetical protein
MRNGDATEVPSTNSPVRQSDVNYDQEKKTQRGGRKDQGRLHAVRNSVLSRGLLETLAGFGESPRALRRIEAELRAQLKPSGPLGELLFDRFWSCVLRLILVSHLEGRRMTCSAAPSESDAEVPYIQDGPVPVLVNRSKGETMREASVAEVINRDLFEKLALIARYDRSASREMYRTLGLLLVMRDGGSKSLTTAVRAAAGLKEFEKVGGSDA